MGQAGPGFDCGVGDQAAEQRADGFGAEEDGFLVAAGVEQAVGEDVAAVGVGAELDFVHGDEGASRSSGMASTVQENQRASGGTIFSSPVMRATFRSPLRATMRS